MILPSDHYHYQWSASMLENKNWLEIIWYPTTGADQQIFFIVILFSPKQHLPSALLFIFYVNWFLFFGGRFWGVASDPIHTPHPTPNLPLHQLALLPCKTLTDCDDLLSFVPVESPTKHTIIYTYIIQSVTQATRKTFWVPPTGVEPMTFHTPVRPSTTELQETRGS